MGYKYCNTCNGTSTKENMYCVTYKNHKDYYCDKNCILDKMLEKKK